MLVVSPDSPFSPTSHTNLETPCLLGHPWREASVWVVAKKKLCLMIVMMWEWSKLEIRDVWLIQPSSRVGESNKWLMNDDWCLRTFWGLTETYRDGHSRLFDRSGQGQEMLLIFSWTCSCSGHVAALAPLLLLLFCLFLLLVEISRMLISQFTG